MTLYVLGFAVGGEPPDTDAALVARYSDSGERAKEMAAFFLIAGAALAFVLFASGLRSRLAGNAAPPRTLAAVAWAGAIGYATLVLTGNAIPRATAAASSDELFTLDPDTHRLFETAGFLLASSPSAAILLVGRRRGRRAALRRPPALARLDERRRHVGAVADRDRLRRLLLPVRVGARRRHCACG